MEDVKRKIKEIKDKGILDLNKRNFFKKGALGLAGVGGIIAFSELTKAWRILGFGDGTTQSTAASGVSDTPTFTSLSTDTISEKTAANGVSIDGVVLKDSGITANAPIFLDDTADDNNPSLAFTNDTNTGIHHWGTGDSGNMSIVSNGAKVMNFTNAGGVFLSETANNQQSQGMTINIGSGEGHILGFKHGDGAHGMTSLAETDTIFYATGSSGSQLWRWLSDNANGWEPTSTATGETTTDTTSSNAGINFRMYIKSGTTQGSYGSTGNLIGFANGASKVMLLKGDGTVHASDTSWATALDTEDDVKALRVFNRAVATKGYMKSAWDRFIGDQDYEYLQQIGVAGSTNPEKGRPDMFAIQPTIMLGLGATWQVAENLMAFIEAACKRDPQLMDDFAQIMKEKAGRTPMLQIQDNTK
jgi:hypothetical protein